jgi:hypothetical protein
VPKHLYILTQQEKSGNDSEGGDERMIEVRRSMYLCWIVALCGVLAFLLWTQFIWHLLLAIMVVQVMVR